MFNIITKSGSTSETLSQMLILIDKYNKVMDLTAVSGEDEMYDRHFYNSLTVAFNENFNGLHLCDVGAGAGLCLNRQGYLCGGGEFVVQRVLH